MEACESSSYGCLDDSKPSVAFDRFEISLRHSYALDSRASIETDPDSFSMRWTDSIAFDFNLPICKSPPLVHADQIFSNGQLLPFHQLMSSSMKKEACFSSDSAPNSVLTRSLSLDSLEALLAKNRPSSLHTCHCLPQKPSKNSPWKFLRKYLKFMFPLYKKVKKLKVTSSGKSRSCGDSPISSARMSNEFSNVDQVRPNRVFDTEFESSIHDAVLHCKKSIATPVAESSSIL